MTSLTFVSMFKQFYAMFVKPSATLSIRIVRGLRGPYPPTLKNLVILCFERRYSKQNTVATPQKMFSLPNSRPPNFWPGYTTAAIYSSSGEPIYYHGSAGGPQN